MSEEERVETRLAHIQRKGNGLIETRFKSEALIDEEGMRENIHTRRNLCAEKPHALLTVVPHDVQFASSVMPNDLFPDVEDRARITAIALVTPNGVPGMMARLYFSYFPDVATTRVFNDEQNAVKWLETKLVLNGN